MTRGSKFQRLPSFTIINDAVALEITEQYGLSISNHSITNGVTLGPDTTIHVMDDDGNNTSTIVEPLISTF